MANMILLIIYTITFTLYSPKTEPIHINYTTVISRVGIRALLWLSFNTIKVFMCGRFLPHTLQPAIGLGLPNLYLSWSMYDSALYVVDAKLMFIKGIDSILFFPFHYELEMR